MRTDRGQRVLQALNAAALAAGLSPGQPVADAEALVPGLRLEPADPADEARRLHALAERARRYGPAVMIWETDALLVDVTGCAHLFGGESGLLDRALSDFKDWDIPVRAALADTPLAALALARAGSACRIAPPGGTAAALAPLPLAALDLAPDLCARLARLGWRRIGDLAAVPRASLARRFGLDLARILAEAWGERATALTPIASPPRFEAATELTYPLNDAAQLVEITKELLDALLPRLEQAGHGIQALDMRCGSETGPPHRVEIGFASPTRDAPHILKLVALRLAAAPAPREVTAVGLAVTASAPLPPAAPALPGTPPRPESTPPGLAPLIDRLAGRLGAGRVYGLAPGDSHWPERGQIRVPPLAPALTRSVVDRSVRPVRLLRHPEPIEAVAPVPDAPPVLIRWRRVARRIVRADGPERIGAEWWRETGAPAPPPDRDYYRVEDETGRRYWVFRAGPMTGAPPPRWYLHGVFA